MTQIEDIRLEILWCCRSMDGELWPDEIAERLDLDICETIEAMEMLADTGQLERIGECERIEVRRR